MPFPKMLLIGSIQLVLLLLSLGVGVANQNQSIFLGFDMELLGKCEGVQLKRVFRVNDLPTGNSVLHHGVRDRLQISEAKSKVKLQEK